MNLGKKRPFSHRNLEMIYESNIVSLLIKHAVVIWNYIMKIRNIKCKYRKIFKKEILKNIVQWINIKYQIPINLCKKKVKFLTMILIKHFSIWFIFICWLGDYEDSKCFETFSNDIFKIQSVWSPLSMCISNHEIFLIKYLKLF